MKKEFVIVFFFILLGISLVSPGDMPNTENIEISCALIEPMKNSFIGIEIPKAVPFSDEIFQIYVNKTFLGKVTIEKSFVTDFNCVEDNERTYDLDIENFEVFQDFTNSESPIDAFNEKLSSGEIKIRGVTFGKKTKMFFTKMGLKILGWFI